MKSKRAQQLQKDYLESQKIQNTKKVSSQVINQVYDVKHMLACQRNNIFIYYVPIDNYSGKIAILKNGIERRGSAIYKNQGQKFRKNEVVWWKVVEKLYTQEYMKLSEGLREIRLAEVELEVEIVMTKTRKYGNS